MSCSIYVRKKNKLEVFMSKDIRKLVISQGIANLADVFFRVVVIANVFVLSGSVISTSLVPILIGLSSFLASFLVPLV